MKIARGQISANIHGPKPCYHAIIVVDFMQWRSQCVYYHQKVTVAITIYYSNGGAKIDLGHSELILGHPSTEGFIRVD